MQHDVRGVDPVVRSVPRPRPLRHDGPSLAGHALCRRAHPRSQIVTLCGQAPGMYSPRAHRGPRAQDDPMLTRTHAVAGLAVIVFAVAIITSGPVDGTESASSAAPAASEAAEPISSDPASHEPAPSSDASEGASADPPPTGDDSNPGGSSGGGGPAMAAEQRDGREAGSLDRGADRGPWNADEHATPQLLVRRPRRPPLSRRHRSRRPSRRRNPPRIRRFPRQSPPRRRPSS